MPSDGQPIPRHAASAAFDIWLAERQGPAGRVRRRRTRLQDLVRHARESSVYYRRRFAQLPDNPPLSELPVVSKPDLMAHFDDWLTDPSIGRTEVDAFLADPSLAGHPFQDQYFVCTTSGTTGRPGIFLHDRAALNIYRALALTRLEPRWIPPAVWPRMLRHRMRWAAVVGTGAHFAGTSWMEAERRRSRWRRNAYRVFSIQQPLDSLVRELNAYDPAILTVYPSSLQQLCDQQQAGRLRIAPVMIEATGESLTQDVSDRARTTFGCRVCEAYAASECMFMAFGCDAGWLHVNDDWVILEAVDAELQPTPPGEPSHTTLLTNLANRVQPLIRYDLGDSIVYQAGLCRCGNPLPGIRVSGRRDDVLRLTSDNGDVVEILPLAVGTVIDRIDAVQRCQLVQTGPQSIRVRLSPAPDQPAADVWAALIGSLQDYLRDQGASGVELIAADEPPVQASPGGKFRRVIAAP